MVPPQANFIRKATVCLHSFISICADSETVGMVIDMNEKTQSLLDEAAAFMECPCLSDLRFLTPYQRCVLAAFFSRLNTKDYPLSEWNDALEYLTHAKKAHDSATAHELLLEHLRALQCG